MPRASTRLRWERTDGRFRVVVFARQDHASYRVEFGFRGDRPASRSAADEPEAVAIASGIWNAYQGGEIDAPVTAPATMGEMIDIIAEQPEHSLKTRKGYRQTWEQFAAFIGERAPHRIFPMDVGAFLARYSGATRDRYLRELRAGLNYALREKWIVENPCANERQQHKRVMGPFLPVEEWPTYFAGCTPAHRIRSEAVCESGLRAGELAAMRLDWLRGMLRQKSIAIAEDPRSNFVPKWGMARAVPLTKRGMEVIDEAIAMWGAARGEDFVFSADGLSALGNLSAETREACARSGCTTTTFHGLRRSYGAAMLERGVSMHELSRLLGHRDERTTSQWYAGMTDRHLGAVVARADEARAERGVTSIRSAKRSAKRSPRG